MDNKRKGKRPTNYMANKRAKDFVKLVASGMTQSDAYKQVYGYEGENAHVLSSQLMNRPKTQAELEKATADLTPEWVADRLQELSFNSKRDADKLRAIELIGKLRRIRAFDSDSTQQQLNIIGLNELEDIKNKLSIPRNDTKLTDVECTTSQHIENKEVITIEPQTYNQMVGFDDVGYPVCPPPSPPVDPIITTP